MTLYHLGGGLVRKLGPAVLPKGYVLCEVVKPYVVLGVEAYVVLGVEAWGEGPIVRVKPEDLGEPIDESQPGLF